MTSPLTPEFPCAASIKAFSWYTYQEPLQPPGITFQGLRSKLEGQSFDSLASATLAPSKAAAAW
ncbi:MAG: hypothetical protein ISQ85_06900 [Planktomarina sp.]|nr:hypothetical protein [Planktomarina sp.]